MWPSSCVTMNCPSSGRSTVGGWPASSTTVPCPNERPMVAQPPMFLSFLLVITTCALLRVLTSAKRTLRPLEFQSAMAASMLRCQIVGVAS